MRTPTIVAAVVTALLTIAGCGNATSGDLTVDPAARGTTTATDVSGDPGATSRHEPPSEYDGLDVAAELLAATDAARDDDLTPPGYRFTADGEPAVVLDGRICGWADRVADDAGDDAAARRTAVHQAVTTLGSYDGDGLTYLVGITCAAAASCEAKPDPETPQTADVWPCEPGDYL